MCFPDIFQALIGEVIDRIRKGYGCKWDGNLNKYGPIFKLLSLLGSK